MTNQYPSIRGLSDGFEATPLRDFWGKLDSITTISRNNRLIVQFNFTEVQVVKATTPYDFPVAVIELPQSARKKSTWGFLSDSIAKLIPEAENLGYLVGKRLHWAMTPGHMLWNRDVGKDVERDCWEVLAIGQPAAPGVVPGKTLREQTIELMMGKTEAEFNQAYFPNAALRQGSEGAAIQQQILAKTFIGSVLSEGKVKKDADGRFHWA